MMKFEVDADIMGRTYHNQFGQLERNDIWWEGGRIAKISIPFIDEWCDTVTVEVGQVIHLGRLRLRVIKQNHFSYYVMKDGWRTWVYYWLVRGAWWAELAYRRLILTAVVWGLAEYEAGRLPTWRDLRGRRTEGRGGEVREGEKREG